MSLVPPRRRSAREDLREPAPSLVIDDHGHPEDDDGELEAYGGGYTAPVQPAEPASSFPEKLSAETGQYFCRELTRKEKWLLLLTGIQSGLLRAAYCIPVYLVFLFHENLPPVNNSVNDANITSYSVHLLSDIWGYSRFVLEGLATLIIIGDAFVTLVSYTGRTGGWYSFISLFEVPHWVLRILVALVASSNLSCDAYEYIEEHLSLRMATAYAALPLGTVVSGVVCTFAWKIVVVKDISWFSFPSLKRGATENLWRPRVTHKKSDDSERSTCAKAQSILILLVPMFCLALELMGLIMVANGDTYSCCSWRVIINYLMHVALSIITIVYAIYRICKKSTGGIYFMLPWLLGYLTVSVLADLQYHVSDMTAFALVQIIGVILLICLPFLIIPFPCDAETYCGQRLVWATEFVANLKQPSKWYRAVTVAIYAFALCGGFKALCASRMDWFKFDMHLDGNLNETFKLARDFCGETDVILNEAEAAIVFSQSFDAYENCSVYNEQLNDALALVISNGTGACKAELAALEEARFYQKLAVRLERYKGHFTMLCGCVQGMMMEMEGDGATLVMRISKNSVGLIVLQLPVYVTALVGVLFAFWPRLIYAPEVPMKKKQHLVIFGVSAMSFVFNIFGLILVEVWANMVTTIADDIPMIESTRVDLEGWNWLQGSYTCAIVSSALFLLTALVTVIVGIKYLKVKPETYDARTGDYRNEDYNAIAKIAEHQTVAKKVDQVYFPGGQEEQKYKINAVCEPMNDLSKVPRFPQGMLHIDTPAVTKSRNKPKGHVYMDVGGGKTTETKVVESDDVATQKLRAQRKAAEIEGRRHEHRFETKEPEEFQYPWMQAEAKREINYDDWYLEEVERRKEVRVPEVSEDTSDDDDADDDETVATRSAYESSKTSEREDDKSDSGSDSWSDTTDTTASTAYFANARDQGKAAPRVRSYDNAVAKAARARPVTEVKTASVSQPETNAGRPQVTEKNTSPPPPPPPPTVATVKPSSSCCAPSCAPSKADKPRSAAPAAKIPPPPTVATVYPSLSCCAPSCAPSKADKPKSATPTAKTPASEDNQWEIITPNVKWDQEVLMPRGWIFALVVITAAAVLSMVSLGHDWLIFKVTKNAQWIAPLSCILHQGNSTILLLEDIKDDATYCNLATTDLSSLLPNIMSDAALDTWAGIASGFQTIETDLSLAATTSVGHNAAPTRYSAIFAIPTILLWVRFILGFVASFFPRGRQYFTGKDVRRWTSAVAVYQMLALLGTTVTLGTLFHNVPLVSVTPHIEIGMVLWIVAQILVLMSWVILNVDQYAPMHFEYLFMWEQRVGVKWNTSVKLDSIGKVVDWNTRDVRQEVTDA